MSWFSKKDKETKDDDGCLSMKECCESNGVYIKTVRRQGHEWMINYVYYRCKKCGHTWISSTYND